MDSFSYSGTLTCIRRVKEVFLQSLDDGLGTDGSIDDGQLDVRLNHRLAQLDYRAAVCEADILTSLLCGSVIFKELSVLIENSLIGLRVAKESRVLLSDLSFISVESKAPIYNSPSIDSIAFFTSFFLCHKRWKETGQNLLHASSTDQLI